MTDERIKEEFDTWISDIECTDNERRFFNQYPSIDQPTAVGFYAGFRAAERLAKIEALEEVKRKTELKKDDYYADEGTLGMNVAYDSVIDDISSMIAELKEANR